MVRIEHDERIFHAPVGSVGDVRHPGQSVEGDVVAARVARQHFLHALTQRQRLVEMAGESIDGGVCGGAQVEDLFVTQAPFVDLAQAVTQGVDQRTAAARIGQQIVFQIRIALHDPDVAQHFVEHARRAASDALAAQLVENCPVFCTEQTDDDFPVGKGGVVVGDFPQANGHEGTGWRSKSGF